MPLNGDNGLGSAGADHRIFNDLGNCIIGVLSGSGLSDGMLRLTMASMTAGWGFYKLVCVCFRSLICILDSSRLCWPLGA